MKKNVTLLIVCVVLVICFFSGVYINQLNNEIESLEYELESLGYKNIELKECPMCGKDVKLREVDNSFIIECGNLIGAGGCGLRTGYYSSKQKLIKAWNEIE